MYEPKWKKKKENKKQTSSEVVGTGSSDIVFNLVLFYPE